MTCIRAFIVNLLDSHTNKYIYNTPIDSLENTLLTSLNERHAPSYDMSIMLSGTSN